MQGINKRKVTLSILFVLILIVIALFVGKFTFSYMGPDIGEDLIIEGDVTAASNTLIFSKGNDLSISATTDNFDSTSGNLTATTNPKVTLSTNAKDGANAKYYAGIKINKNTFTYSTPEKTAEILLTVKDENGNIVSTSSDTLEYKTVNGISGFDITDKVGPFNIVADHSISTTTSTTHTWTFIITFINFTTDQSINENATLELEASLYKERIFTLSAYVNSLYTTQGANHLYRHDGTIFYSDGTTVKDAEDNSIRYAGGDYKITAAHSDIEKISTLENDSPYTSGAIIGMKCDGYSSYVGSYCASNKTYYLLYNDTASYTTYDEAAEQAIKDGYLESTPVKNYVCFGYDDPAKAYTSGWCPVDNLYRIIGVIDNKVKVIKAEPATEAQLGAEGARGTGNFVNGESHLKSNTVKYSGYRGQLETIDRYKWTVNTGDWINNEWEKSVLRTTHLTNYLNNLGSYAEIIATSTWYVSGNTDDIMALESSAKEAYEAEIGKNKLTTKTPINAKLGLMYVSEYYYGAEPSHWGRPGKKYGTIKDYRYAKDSNWLYLGVEEWTISRESTSQSAFYVDIDSRMNYNTAYSDDSSFAVRPTFSLVPTVIYAGGTGTASDPYRISK